MAIVKSTEFVASAQEMQSNVIEGLDVQPHMLIVRYFDPADPDRYRPTASYAAQIRNHGAKIGATTSEVVVMPGGERQAADVIAHASDDRRITSVMPLFPLPDRADALARLNPAHDADDLLGLNGRAPTARSMATLANISLHGDREQGGADYFTGMTLDELAQLNLPEGWTADNICFGGEGALTGKPLRSILARQGILVPDEHVATHHTPERLQNLPDPALIFTATPTAQQIKDRDIHPGSVIIDAGFGIVNGRTYGNTEASVAGRDDVLWTPPVAGVGPGSTTFLWHHTLEAAGVPAAQMPRLGQTAILHSVQFAS